MSGRRAYQSGDTGLTGDMRTVVHGFYRANLAVLNIGDVFTTGPEEGAFVVRSLVRPKAVIPSHVNEVATIGGAVNPGTDRRHRRPDKSPSRRRLLGA